MDSINQRAKWLDSELKSTSEAVYHECPRFRILVLGKHGAGKSSLINEAFKVDIANVSHGKAGKSDINKEIISDSNPRFVLHDSQGFEPGEVNNFNIVKDFIEKRSEEAELKDRLHAIWLCIEIPHAGGRVFEVGDEEFLKLDLGHVPVVVVFTKHDLLVNSISMNADFDLIDSMSEEEFNAYVKVEADKEFDKVCLAPYRRICAERNHPYVKVSKEYPQSLEELIEITRENVSEAVWIIWAVAQRGNADINIAASIAVGKKKYWRSLASSAHFPKKTLEKCLNTIHKDIVSVWNFHDPDFHLASREFKGLMSHVVEDLYDPNPSNPNKILAIGITGVASLAGIVTAVSGPAAPIVIPIAAGFVLATWAYGVYQETPAILRCLMGYIVDLTIVMQSLFWLMRARTGIVPVTRRLVKIAFTAYNNSPDKPRVHGEITTYVDKTRVWHRAGSDHAFEEIVRLIHAHRFDPTKDFKSEAEKAEAVAPVENEEDEPWDVSDLQADVTGAEDG